MLKLAAYHGRMILGFAAANKRLTVVCLTLVFVAGFVAHIPNEEIARKIGVEQTFADMLISSVGSGNSFSAAWCIVPLVTQGYLSHVFSQNYTENFVLRWRRRWLVGAGKIIDTLMVSIVASLVLIASVALISYVRGCAVSNFSDAHSLLSYFAQEQVAREPDPVYLVMVMGAYTLLAVSTVNQCYLLLNKFIGKDAAVISILLLVGYFQLYSGSGFQFVFGNAVIEMRDVWNPLSIIYATGDVGYASWLDPSFHRLLPMFVVLAVLVLLNGVIPEKPRRN